MAKDKKNKKIILINPPSNCVDNDRLEPPMGLMYIAAVLRENRYANVSINDMTGCKSEDEIQSKINQLEGADAYGLTVLCSNHNYAKMCVERIKQINPTALVIAGGPNPSALPNETLLDMPLDAIITGEGEDAFLNLIEADVQAADFRNKSIADRIIAGTGRQVIDSYPFPARDLVDLGSYVKKLEGKDATSMISSRGCFYNCMHCNSPIMGGGSHGARYRSADNMIAEIKKVKELGYDSIVFTDDNFTSNPKLEELLARMAELRKESKDGLKFRVFARVDDLDDDTCKQLAEAGCVHVTIGLESMDPKNLEAISKGNMIGKAENVANAKKYAMIVRSSFMVGLPNDTDANIETYFGEAAKLPFDEFEVHPLIPFPGSRVAKNPEGWNYEILEKDFRKYLLIGRERATTYVLRHGGDNPFTPQDVMRWRERARQILETSPAYNSYNNQKVVMSKSKMA